MDNILIIKLGALGDVVRTTPLLRVLKGNITWITRRNALPLLKNNSYIDRILDIDALGRAFGNNCFDLVINLDEEDSACILAAELKKREMVGPYMSGSQKKYTDSSAEWFDMSLISRLGRNKANSKKWSNKKTYQEILFSMVGKKFKGEEYVLPVKGKAPGKDNLVGMEMRSGERWTAKRWPHDKQLAGMMKDENIPCRYFRQYPTLDVFMHEINKADIVLTTDSLAMHLALGLKKNVAAIFTCTSPREIYGYGRMCKIISPLLEKYYYSTLKTLKPGQAIPPENVFGAINGFLK